MSQVLRGLETRGFPQLETMTDPRDLVTIETTMKAIVQDRYGSPDVLELREIDEPVAGSDDVLIRVQAASAFIGDWHVMSGLPRLIRLVSGLRKPNVPAAIRYLHEGHARGKVVIGVRPQ